jgi:transposase-like protein
MMDTQRQWCDNEACPDFGRMGTANIKVYSFAERRFYCITCQRTFSADKGTFFETVRTPRRVLLDIVAMLVERNSLRAISRIKHCKADTVLHWLDLAGQQAAAVSRYVIHDLHLTQAQIDELWTFVKKNKNTDNRTTRLNTAIRGFGAPSRCRVIYGS